MNLLKTRAENPCGNPSSTPELDATKRLLLPYFPVALPMPFPGVSAFGFRTLGVKGLGSKGLGSKGLGLGFRV